MTTYDPTKQIHVLTIADAVEAAHRAEIAALTEDYALVAGYMLRLEAERDQYKARLATLEAALAIALEYDIPGVGWASDGNGGVYDSIEASHAVAACVSGDIAALIAAAVNAVRRVKEFEADGETLRRVAVTEREYRARLDALMEALAPALEALEGATPGEWEYDEGSPYVWLAPPNGFPRYDLMKSYDLSACELAAAAVNAVRRVKEAQS